MKYFIFVSLIALNVFAAKAKMPVQASEKAQYIYREFLANQEDSFIIQATKCNPSKNELNVQKFYSGNTIHIYVRAGDCKTTTLNSVWSETIHIPKSKNMTQVYITLLSENVMVL
ncbi:hypothetical protein CIK05_01315 [Bdellovibrio sp. qaytius]|nr:hypothetical protein CIK05_01315 [Bdellovibrio sp. qaytius]